MPLPARRKSQSRPAQPSRPHCGLLPMIHRASAWAPSDLSSNPRSAYKPMALGTSSQLSTSETSTYLTGLQKTRQEAVTAGLPSQVHCDHLRLAGNSECPRAQVLSAPRGGRSCSLTSSKGHTEVGVGRLRRQHRPAGLSLRPRARRGSSPPSAEPHPAPSASSPGRARARRSRFSASASPGAKATADSPKLS